MTYFFQKNPVAINRNLRKIYCAVNQISKSNIHKYGVIKPEDINSAPIKVEDIVEKPSADEAPSDMLYVEDIFLMLQFLNT